MGTYIAFLRAINLGAKRQFGKDAVVAATAATGASDVAAYLNTGNVRLDSTLPDPAAVEAVLEAAFLADRGFEVPTVVLTQAELRAVAADADRLAEGHTGRHSVSFLKRPPTVETVAALNAACAGEGVARVGGRAVHLLTPGPDYHTARLTNALVERHLGPATNRNLTVVRTLVERWCG